MSGGTGVLGTESERQVVVIRWVHQDFSFRQRMRLSIGPVSFLSRAQGGKTPLCFIDWRTAFGKAGVLSFPHGIRRKDRAKERARGWREVSTPRLLCAPL